MATLHDDCFAYKLKRKYPIHTKKAMLQSYSQYLSQLQDIPQSTCSSINDNFVKAAKLYDIKLDSPIQEENIRQLDTFIDQQGNIISFTKIATISDIQKFNAQLESNRQNLPFNTLRKLALKAFKQGQKLGAPQSILQPLSKKAALGVGNKQQMLSQFLKRASFIMLPETAKQTFYRLYNKLDQQDQDAMLKRSSQMYNMIYDIDNLYNLTGYYGSNLKAPQDVCCSITVNSLLKEASDYMHVQSTDTVLSKTALLQNKQKIQSFLKQYYNFQTKSDQQLLNKVAGLSKHAIESLIYTLE